MLSSLKHKNVVSIVGFCNEVGAETIIYKDESRGTLGKNLHDVSSLTWVKRLKISVGIVHALSYIHYDEQHDFSVIHRNIDSFIVALTNDWEPKLSNFQHSMKIKASERHHTFHTDSVWSPKGYTYLTYEDTSSVNHNSDIYSFGMLLFELLCGRRSVTDDLDNKYLAPVAIFHYRNKILHEIIDLKLLKQMDPKSYNIFVATAYDRLNEEQLQRPNIDEIVARLEKALGLQLAGENRPEHTVVAAKVEGTSSGQEEGSVTFVSIGVESNVSKNTMYSLKDLSQSKLTYEDITSATNLFAPENIIRIYRFGTIYKGCLLHSELHIIAKRFLTKYLKDESKRFWTEISILSCLKHKNLVSFVGWFCDEEFEKIIIFKKEAHGRLNKYLSDPTLTWMQRLKICVGAGKALSYIHYDVGRDFSVIHVIQV